MSSRRPPQPKMTPQDEALLRRMVGATNRITKRLMEKKYILHQSEDGRIGAIYFSKSGLALQRYLKDIFNVSMESIHTIPPEDIFAFIQFMLKSESNTNVRSARK